MAGRVRRDGYGGTGTTGRERRDENNGTGIAGRVRRDENNGMDNVSGLHTREQGRRFGLTVGAAFIVLGAIASWRGRDTVALVFWTLGGLLVVAGLLVPRGLQSVERAWMAGAHAISRVTTPIVLGILWFIAITPIAFLTRLFRRRPEVSPGSWVPRAEGARRSNLTRQF